MGSTPRLGATVASCDHHGGMSLVGTHGWIWRYVRCWHCDLKVRVGLRRPGYTQGESFVIYEAMVATGEVNDRA